MNCYSKLTIDEIIDNEVNNSYSLSQGAAQEECGWDYKLILHSPLQTTNSLEFLKKVTYLPIKKNSQNAKIPTRESKDSTGYDLYTLEGKIVPTYEQTLIPTDISIVLPQGTYGHITPRSGLTAKHQINIHIGVINANYRGSLSIILFNHSNSDFIITLGDRIVQLIIKKIDNPLIVEVTTLPTTRWAEDSFRSTGGIHICSDNPEREINLSLKISPLRKSPFIDIQALLDSGTNEVFIDCKWAEDNLLQLQPLQHPIIVYNVDGTTNSTRWITHMTNLIMDFQGHWEKILAEVIDLGKNQMVLGYTWLKCHNPIID